MSGHWKSGLIESLTDPILCVQTLFCPCVTYGQISHKVDPKHLIGGGKCGMPCFAFCLGMLCGCEPCMVCNLRYNVMIEKRIQADDICTQHDCPEMCVQFCWSWLCFYCVLCQIKKEYDTDSGDIGKRYITVPVFVNSMIINSHY